MERGTRTTEGLQIIEQPSQNPETRQQGIALAAATRDGRYRATLEAFAQDAKAARGSTGRRRGGARLVRVTPNRVLDQLIVVGSRQAQLELGRRSGGAGHCRGSMSRGRSGRALDRRELPARSAPGGIADPRRSCATAARVIELARAGKLPDDLKTEATTLLHTSPDRRLRERGGYASCRCPRRPAAGRCRRSVELIRRQGDADKGGRSSSAPAPTACGSCHRVQGHGHWVGPDLSTIGVKYGRDELIRSILSPSAAIGFSFRSHRRCVDRRASDHRTACGGYARPADLQDGRRTAG